MTDSKQNCKRKTVKPSSCPNPLFEKWLEEWKAEAASKNSDIQYSYGKALQSLRKYPILLNNGKECLILQNFGKHLCNKLDQRLAEYRKSNPEYFSQVTSLLRNSSSVPSTSNSSINEKQSSVPDKYLKPKKRKNNLIDKDETNTVAPPAIKKRAYIPGKRSAPYAILITLLKESKKINYPGFLSKIEIQTKAQDLCDSSFTKPQPGSHYTAWNGMSMMMKKNLVKKEGNPGRYSLTDDGEALAIKLLNELNREEKLFPLKSKNLEVPSFEYLSSSPRKISSLPSPKSKRFQKLSPHQKNDDILSTLLEDKFLSTDKKKKDFLKDLDNNDCIVIDDDDEIDIDSGINDIIGTDNFKNSNISSPSSQNSHRTGNCNLDTDSYPSSSCSHRTENSNADNDSLEQLIFMPGEFKVLLLVDIHETTGRMKKTSEETQQELTNLKTNFEVRHLKVGDFTWVARNNAGDELLLPYIVERKRMDDLASSIKDGRFHEQKFRLRQCGLPNMIYLIEKYGNDNTRFGIPFNTLQQAIVNTQVVDKFFIKTTNNHGQSMLYLSVFTNLLSNIFKDKTLVSCARTELPKFNINSDLVSLQTFKEFSKLSAKHRKLKVRDLFLKHLLRLKGMSLDRALVITNKYPTPRCIKQAFDEAETPENLLANLPYGQLGRNIGAAISKHIYELYTRRNLP